MSEPAYTVFEAQRNAAAYRYGRAPIPTEADREKVAHRWDRVAATARAAAEADSLRREGVRVQRQVLAQL